MKSNTDKVKDFMTKRDKVTVLTVNNIELEEPTADRCLQIMSSKRIVKIF